MVVGRCSIGRWKGRRPSYPEVPCYWCEEGDGKLKLVQHHCPVLEAASGCSELCEVEIEALQDLLGEDVVIEQTEQITTGGRSCSFRITAKQGDDQQV